MHVKFYDFYLPTAMEGMLTTESVKKRWAYDNIPYISAQPSGGLFSILWPPYVIAQAIYIFILWFLLLSFFLSFFFSSPNLSGRRLDVYHTSTHGVALV